MFKPFFRYEFVALSNRLGTCFFCTGAIHKVCHTLLTPPPLSVTYIMDDLARHFHSITAWLTLHRIVFSLFSAQLRIAAQRRRSICLVIFGRLGDSSVTLSYFGFSIASLLRIVIISYISPASILFSCLFQLNYSQFSISSIPVAIHI